MNNKPHENTVDHTMTGHEACAHLRLTPVAFDKLYWVADDELTCESDEGAHDKAWAMTFKLSALQKIPPHLLERCREQDIALVASRVQGALEEIGMRLSIELAITVTRRFWDDAIWGASVQGDDPAETVVRDVLHAVAMPSFEYTAEEEAGSLL